MLLFSLRQGALGSHPPHKETVPQNVSALPSWTGVAAEGHSYDNGKIHFGLNLIGHWGRLPPLMTKSWLLFSLLAPACGFQSFDKLMFSAFLPCRKVRNDICWVEGMLHYRWQHGCWDSMRHRPLPRCTSWPGTIIKYPKLPKAQSTWIAAGEDSWQSLDSKEIRPVNPKGNQPWIFIHWKDWCWSWSSNTLITWCEKLTHWKGPWCWEKLKAGGEVGDRGQDGWMASPNQWTWVWANSGR